MMVKNVSRHCEMSVEYEEANHSQLRATDIFYLIHVDIKIIMLKVHHTL